MIVARHCYRSRKSTERLSTLRMIWVPFQQNLRGIVLAHNMNGVLAISAWYDSCDPAIIYKDNSRFRGCVQWMFFPLVTAESVSEVWVRQDHLKDLSLPALFVRTTLQRSYTFGPYIHSSRDAYEFKPITSDSDGEVTGLFHSAGRLNTSSINILGITCGPKRNERPMQVIPEHPILKGIPPGAPNSGWCGSRVSLQGAERIQRCWVMSHDKIAIIGLLVLGQWRWDLQIDTIYPTTEDSYLNFRLDEISNQINITDVIFTA